MCSACAERDVPLGRDVCFASDVRFAREGAEHITSLCAQGAIHHYGEAITSLRQRRNITKKIPLALPAILWYNGAKKGAVCTYGQMSLLNLLLQNKADKTYTDLKEKFL